jgi:hypothetical protein
LLTACAVGSLQSGDPSLIFTDERFYSPICG